MNKGDLLLLPIIALHRDPKYFPNPDKFDPERFRDEKNSIVPMSFMPFGGGLRHCIGERERENINFFNKLNNKLSLLLFLFQL